MTQDIDRARLTLLLNGLRLSAIKQGWVGRAERADKEAWPAARFPVAFAEHEVAERDRRRTEHHRLEARLSPGKTLDSVEFAAVSTISKAHVGNGPQMRSACRSTALTLRRRIVQGFEHVAEHRTEALAAILLQRTE